VKVILLLHYNLLNCNIICNIFLLYYAVSGVVKKKSELYLSQDNKNDLLKIMAMNILCSISKNLQETEFGTVIMDECADITNNERVNNFHV